MSQTLDRGFYTNLCTPGQCLTFLVPHDMACSTRPMRPRVGRPWRTLSPASCTPHQLQRVASDVRSTHAYRFRRLNDSVTSHKDQGRQPSMGRPRGVAYRYSIGLTARSAGPVRRPAWSGPAGTGGLRVAGRRRLTVGRRRVASSDSQNLLQPDQRIETLYSLARQKRARPQRTRESTM